MREETKIVTKEVGQTGWTRYFFENGKHADTKLENIIADADRAMASGEIVLANINESDGGDNGRGGRWVNRRLQGVTFAGPRQQQLTNAAPPLNQTSNDTPSRILVGMGKEYVARTLALYPEEQRSVHEQMRMIIFWSKFFKLLTDRINEPAEDLYAAIGQVAQVAPKKPQEPLTPSEGWDNYDAGNSPPPRTDDDIPF